MRTFVASALLLLCRACASPPKHGESHTRNLCTDLGWVFYVIAAYAEAGQTENEQLLWANQALGNAATRQTALRIISYVYDAEGAALDLGLDVIDACTTEGQVAVLRLDRMVSLGR